MTLLAASGSLLTTTGTSNVAVTGLGFQPKLVLFFGADRAAQPGTTTGFYMGFGAATGATERGCVLSRSRDAQTTSQLSAFVRSDSCFGNVLGTSDGVNGLLDFVSMDSDGFTVVPDDAFFASYYVYWLALGGDSLTNAKVGNFTLPNSSGNLAQTGVGFQPDALMLFGIHQGASGYNLGAGGGGGFCLGWAKSSTERGCLSVVQRDNISGSDTNHILRTDRLLHLIREDAADADGTVLDLVSFDSDGFTVSRNPNYNTTAGSSTVLLFVALKGIDIKIGSFAAQTNTGQFSVSGVGFKPSALIAMSTLNTTAAETAIASHSKLSFGWATEISQAYLSAREDDALGTTDAFTRQSNDALVYGLDNVFAAESEIDFVSFGSDGFTLDQVDADAAANLILYMALGPGEGGAGAKLPILGKQLEPFNQMGI